MENNTHSEEFSSDFVNYLDGHLVEVSNENERKLKKSATIKRNQYLTIKIIIKLFCFISESK